MNNHGYHTSYCTICERNTPHEDTRCMDCGKFDGEAVEEYAVTVYNNGMESLEAQGVEVLPIPMRAVEGGNEGN